MLIFQHMPYRHPGAVCAAQLHVNLLSMLACGKLPVVLLGYSKPFKCLGPREPETRKTPLCQTPTALAHLKCRYAVGPQWVAESQV